jgi:hypothetical protein
MWTENFAARASGFNYMFFGNEHSIVLYNALREQHWRRNGSAAAYMTAVELFRQNYADEL